jgi:hypothetical protein
MGIIPHGCKTAPNYQAALHCSSCHLHRHLKPTKHHTTSWIASASLGTIYSIQTARTKLGLGQYVCTLDMCRIPNPRSRHGPRPRGSPPRSLRPGQGPRPAPAAGGVKNLIQFTVLKGTGARTSVRIDQRVHLGLVLWQTIVQGIAD